MSITFEFSFNAAIEFPQLVDEVNRALGTSLERDGNTASGSLLGILLVLDVHDLVDDRALNFSAYRYQLWNKTWDGSSLRCIQLEALVLAAFTLHTILGITDGMLSYDRQRLLARYEIADGPWTGDIVDHLRELQNRIEG